MEVIPESNMENTNCEQINDTPIDKDEYIPIWTLLNVIKYKNQIINTNKAIMPPLT